MKIIIGLGNPGVDYSGTRHNVGHMVIDELGKINCPGVILKKSDVYMNQSGEFVKRLSTKYSVQSTDLYIIHDDLDIPFGESKIQFGKGPRDHNGVKSIDEALGSSDYWHVRVGIDNRPADARPMGEEYVLQNFSEDEKKVLPEFIKSICKKLAISLKNTN